MVTESEINNYFDFIYPLAIKAGEILKEGYTSQKEIVEKGVYYDMVTNYDHRIEEFLIDEIGKKYENHKFIGEEESALRNTTITTTTLTNDPTWIIDPIDGTSNFIKQLGHTCVSIALAIDKKIVLGIIINPIQNEIYTAKKGQGSFLNGEKLKVSECEKLTEAHIAYEISLLHVPTIKAKHIKRVYYLAGKSTRAVSYGTVALSLCYVARGSLDAYHIDDMYPWDIAAGSLIIQEAGGIVYNTKGEEFDIMKADLVCGGTENLCQEMIKTITEADQLNQLSFTN